MPFVTCIIISFVVYYLELYDCIFGKSIRSDMSFGDWTNKLLHIPLMGFFSAVKIENLLRHVTA